MELKKRIEALSESVFEEVVGYRRQLHANPELSFEEKETSAFVSEKLEALGIAVQRNVAGHGLTGMIHGAQRGKTLALRGDMDALPITEANSFAHKSRNPGVMHACGHDAHTASLLGTASILTQLTDHIHGSIKLIFQPAEEKVPGGASMMIEEGVLQNPEVAGIYGQHVLPYLETGQIGIRPGMYMASADEIYLRIHGKGGHAAHPATFIDPVTITAQILVTLQQVISRSDPRIPSVLSFGRIRADGATNIIPDTVEVDGTFRCMDEAQRDKALEQIASVAESVAQSLGARAEVDIRRGYPVLFNDEAMTARSRQWIEAYVGVENVVDLDLWMAAEDFAWYTHQVPGCFYRLGTGNEAKGSTHGLHTPLFDVDEDAFRLSTGLMAWLAINELRTLAD